MERLFKVLAAVLLGAAAVLFWLEYRELAFASGVLAFCSYFLDMRFQFKASLNKRARERQAEENDAD
jgi:hypothetical protein